MIMKLKPKKEELLKKLSDINYKYHYKVMNEEPQEDAIGMDKDHLYKALRYVPNIKIKQWIKEMKKEINKKAASFKLDNESGIN